MNESHFNEVQSYFRRQIVKGNYTEVERAYSALDEDRFWLSILINYRPFCLCINNGNVYQTGDYTENYMQLGKLTKEEKETIIKNLIE